MLRSALGLVASVVSALSLIPTASAAPRKQPVYPQAAPVFTWTGFYIGAHAGGGWARWSGEGTTAHGDGVIGGFQIGYNHQFGNYVAGIEGEFSFSGVEREESLFAGTITLKNDYFATIAGRFGYAFDRTLLYGKGASLLRATR